MGLRYSLMFSESPNVRGSMNFLLVTRPLAEKLASKISFSSDRFLPQSVALQCSLDGWYVRCASHSV